MEIGSENMEALKRLLGRAALRGEPIAPEETMARLMNPDCSGGELAGFIQRLVAGGRVTEQDIFELFFSKGNNLKLQIPPKGYTGKSISNDTAAAQRQAQAVGPQPII